MPLAEALDRYFAAWNEHDPPGLAAAFSEDGTYEDPTTDGPLTSAQCADLLARLVLGFPDVHFDLLDVAPTGDRAAYARWVMRGTNTGSGPAGPATGHTVALPGADHIEYDPLADRVSRVVGYFDTATLARQLGLQTHLTPADIDGFATFGTGARIETNRHAIPGAFTVTWIDVDEEHAPALSDAGYRIVLELAENDAYLGSCFTTVGNRHYTFTAWESVESARAALRGGAHAEAMRLANRGGVGSDAVGLTSIWTPAVLNGVFRAGAGKSADLAELGGQWL